MGLPTLTVSGNLATTWRNVSGNHGLVVCLDNSS